MSNQELWNNWDKEQHYGEMFFKRATGELDEMESSKSVTDLIKGFYKAGDTLLDVGCGAGHYLRSLKSGLGDDLDYTGIDPTAYYIGLAQKAYREGAKFRVGNIFSIPFEDNSFDIVMCNNVVMHLPPEKIQQAFDELLRVSKGVVVIRAMFGVRNYLVREILSDGDFNPLAGMKEVFDGTDLTQNKFRYFNMYTETFYHRLIAAGKNVAVEFIQDTNWKPFDNTVDSKINTGTKTLGSLQVSGNLILDWRYIVVRK